MNHTNTITPRWCLLTALFAMALTVAVPPAAIAQKKKTDLPPQKSATALTSITTTEGKTYDAVEITKVNPDSISFVHSAGVATVAFAKLPPDVQRRFNYAPKAAAPSVSAVAKPQIEGSGIQGLNPPIGKPDTAPSLPNQPPISPQVAQPKPNKFGKNASDFLPDEEIKRVFAERRAGFENVNTTFGFKAAFSARDVANMVVLALAIAQRGIENQDDGLKDPGLNMVALAFHGADFTESVNGKKLQGLAAMLAGKTDSQLASMRMTDGSTGLDFIRRGGMKRLMESGDVGAIHGMLGHVEKGGLGSHFNTSDWLQRSFYLDKQDVETASKIADFKTAGVKMHNRQVHDFVAKRLESRVSRADLAAVNRAGGIEKLLDELDLKDFGDTKKFAGVLVAMGVNAAAAEQIGGRLADGSGAIRSMLKGSAEGRGTAGPSELQDALWSVHRINGFDAVWDATKLDASKTKK